MLSCKKNATPTETNQAIDTSANTSSEVVHDASGVMNQREEVAHQIAKKVNGNFELINSETLIKNWNDYHSKSRFYTDFTTIRLISQEEGIFLLRASNSDQTINGLIILEDKDGFLFHKQDREEYCTIICTAKHVDKGCMPHIKEQNDRIEYYCSEISIGICEKAMACRTAPFLTVEHK